MRRLAITISWISVVAWTGVLILSFFKTRERIELGFEDFLLSRPVIASIFGVLITASVAFGFYRAKQYIIVTIVSITSGILAIFVVLSASVAAGG